MTPPTQPEPVFVAAPWTPPGEPEWQLVDLDLDRETRFVIPARSVPAGHVIVPAAEYEQLAAVADAARGYVASEATRHDDTIAHDEWLRGNRAALDALTAAVNALDAPEATDG